MEMFLEKVSQCRKQLKGGTLWVFSTSILSQNSETIEGGPFRDNFFRKKMFHNAEKTQRWDPLVSPGIICYAGKTKNPFGSVPWAKRYILATP